ncbi:MAG: GTPase Era [Pseudomonadota bacterium]|jgi:GTP-binding protein Era
MTDNQIQQDISFSSSNTTSGFVAIVGRPNVGKSTLINQLLGHKISITAGKPQTTRHRILGVKTVGSKQTIYVDTPGIHQAELHALNKEMNKTARSALIDVEAALFVVDSLQWTAEDELVLNTVKKLRCPVFLVVNKVDLVKDKKRLLPHVDTLSKKMHFSSIFLISAEKRIQIDALESAIEALLPVGPHYFPADQITDKSPRFMAAEIIREKLTRFLGQELPYSMTVEIEQFEKEERLYRIGAIIWVERQGQKAIVIGAKGEGLKNIGILARQDLENLLNMKVHLSLWVKVKSGWADDIRALASWGYTDLP